MLTKIIIILAFLISPAFAVNHNDVKNFLGERFDYEVNEKILDAIDRNVKASSCIVFHEGVVYSLSVVPVRTDKSQAMQNNLNLAAIRHASMRAALNLALYLDDGQTSTKDYTHKEVLNQIILNHYESGLRFKSSAGKIINGNAFGLVWSEKKSMPMSDNSLNEEYCRILYERALDDYSSGKYQEAMNEFKSIRYKSWGNHEAYITSSLCMLGMNQKNEAAKLLNEFVSVRGNDITAEESAEAGRILFRAGYKDEGFALMERAYNLNRR